MQATPSQVLSIQLATNPVKIQVYQKRTGLFVDIYVNDKPIITGVLCRDRVWIVREAYRGFPGDLTFIDTQGTSDPDYTGLGSRFLLVWG
ncbi:hypothetical protein LTR94_028399, partial [Friedmanniomyces endolithicus]